MEARKILMTLSVLFSAYVCFADEISSAPSANAIEDNEVALDMCKLDELAGIVCDICSELDVGYDRNSCCVDEKTLYECEMAIMFVSSDKNEEQSNQIDNGMDKKAAWSWKKPRHNRYNNEFTDIGFKGKRNPISLGGVTWKPANYYLDKQYSNGFRLKRMDEGDEEFVEKRFYPGRWSWKPTAYMLSNPYRYDRINYMGKRGMFDWKPSGYDELFDVSSSDGRLSADKRSRYPGRLDWKPAPYRFDSDWGYGKRTSWFGRRPTGRYDWKPYSDDVEKRGSWDWKPENRMLNRWRYGDLSYMGKRFVPTNDFDSSPRNRLLSFTKRGRYDWKPTGGYYDVGLASYNGDIPGKRPSAQFDWKPSSQIYRSSPLDKRDRYSQSWKPWKPATYVMNRNQWFG